MELGSATVGVLLVVAIATSVTAMVLSFLSIAGQRRVRDAYRAFGDGSGGPGQDVLTLLAEHIDQVKGLRGDVREQRRYGHELRGLVAGSISRVQTVRYDAFDDMGGRMSFSSALLDEAGDGVVITSINGRAETRTYAKPVQRGSSRHNLSVEERHVVAKAMAEPVRGGEEDLRPRDRRNGVPPAQVVSGSSE